MNGTLYSDDYTKRSLQWTYRRGPERYTCQVALARDSRGYEFREWTPGRRPRIERFESASQLFHHQSALEDALIAGGWALEDFSSRRGFAVTLLECRGSTDRWPRAKLPPSRSRRA